MNEIKWNFTSIHKLHLYDPVSTHWRPRAFSFTLPLPAGSKSFDLQLEKPSCQIGKIVSLNVNCLVRPLTTQLFARLRIIPTKFYRTTFTIIAPKTFWTPEIFRNREPDVELRAEMSRTRRRRAATFFTHIFKALCTGFVRETEISALKIEQRNDDTVSSKWTKICRNDKHFTNARYARKNSNGGNIRRILEILSRDSNIKRREREENSITKMFKRNVLTQRRRSEARWIWKVPFLLVEY